MKGCDTCWTCSDPKECPDVNCLFFDRKVDTLAMDTELNNSIDSTVKRARSINLSYKETT
jgi:hypothetical protein